jgi:hypothetical protein
VKQSYGKDLVTEYLQAFQGPEMCLGVVSDRATLYTEISYSISVLEGF